MSLNSSLMTYNNNNESINNSTEKIVPSMKKPPILNKNRTQTSSKKKRSRVHLNSLSSLFYGQLAVVGQSYILMQGAKRFIGFSNVDWLSDPWPESWWCLGLLGTAALLLPMFYVAAILKIGNLPNDGFKLGSDLSTCSQGPPCSLPGKSKNIGVLRSLWQHGGPTAPFLHLVIAFCLLLPRLLMEAKLVEGGFLPQDNIWKTDMDFILANKDRQTVLSLIKHENTSTLKPSLPVMNYHSPFRPQLSAITAVPSSSESKDFYTNMPTVSTTLQEISIQKPIRNIISPSVPKKGQNIPNRQFRNTSTTQNPINLSKTNRRKEELATKSRDIPQNLAFNMEKSLKEMIGPVNWDPNDQHIGFGSNISLEFWNYAISLLVYSVRYPAVFWKTNKFFSLIFSFQLLINGIQNLVSFCGMSVLYKIQVIGVDAALPLLQKRQELNIFGGDSPILLNTHVTLALFVLSGILIVSSSLVLYLYGYGRFNTFLNKECQKRIILIKESRPASGWGYFTHCSALCVLLAIAVCCAPLLHDYAIVYRGCLDGTVLICIVSTILHLFLWILVWLFLTIKRKWEFKLRVTIARATLRSTRSIKLVTDVDLIGNRDEDLTRQPLLIVGNGRTYTVTDNAPKKVIMSVIQKIENLESKTKLKENGNEEEEIYWLRPKAAAINPSDSTDKMYWLNKNNASNSASGKSSPRVTFSDVPCTSNSCNKERGTSLRFGEDDGDYATLTELPVGFRGLGDPGDDTSEEGKLLECVQNDDISYVCTNRDLVPPNNLENTSPMCPSNALPDPPTKQYSQTLSIATSSSVIVHTGECQSNNVSPKCRKRGDSGVSGDHQGSGSGSNGSSPPDPADSSTSESSGIHSAASLLNKPYQEGCNLDSQPLTENEHKRFSMHTSRGVSTSKFNEDCKSSIYGYSGLHCSTMIHPVSCVLAQNKIPPTILESIENDNLIIRRTNSAPRKGKSMNPPPVIVEEPFGRSTNMKMTTFANSKEILKNIVSSSATLPHYPTQSIDSVNPQCSTMPTSFAQEIMLLPQIKSGNSHQSFQRTHSTLPNHQGGLRLIESVQTVNHQSHPRAGPSHHSFPVNLFQSKQFLEDKRDSANFSMASSSENIVYVQCARQ